MKIKLNYKMLFFILLFSFTMLLPVKALEEVDSSQSSDNTQTETENENNQSENDIGSLTIELEKDGIKLENVNVFLYQVKYIEDYENLTFRSGFRNIRWGLGICSSVSTQHRRGIYDRHH